MTVFKEAHTTHAPESGLLVLLLLLTLIRLTIYLHNINGNNNVINKIKVFEHRYGTGYGIKDPVVVILFGLPE